MNALLISFGVAAVVLFTTLAIIINNRYEHKRDMKIRQTNLTASGEVANDQIEYLITIYEKDSEGNVLQNMEWAKGHLTYNLETKRWTMKYTIVADDGDVITNSLELEDLGDSEYFLKDLQAKMALTDKLHEIYPDMKVDLDQVHSNLEEWWDKVVEQPAQ